MTDVSQKSTRKKLAYPESKFSIQEYINDNSSVRVKISTRIQFFLKARSKTLCSLNYRKIPGEPI